MSHDSLLPLDQREVLNPGDYIRKELELRGWTQSDLAQIINRPMQAINETVLGKRSITPEMAKALGAAFGMEASYWMQRESEYRLSLVGVDPDVGHRARLYDLVPVKDMEKRGWIERASNPQELERELCQFFSVESLDQEPRVNAAARKSLKVAELSGAEKAWCVRAGKLAATLKVDTFRPSHFEAGLTHLRGYADFPEKVKHVPNVLAEMGVRFVVNEQLPHTQIDGAAFWLDDNSPTVVVSMRHDRIDGFWFTLMHELMHVRHGDEQSVDSDLIGEQRMDAKLEMEARADREAAELLIGADKLHSFIIRTKPFYSKVRINQFAQRLRVHPGIVTGQLQHRKEIGFGVNREMLVKIRGTLISAALTDGWGCTLPKL